MRAYFWQSLGSGARSRSRLPENRGIVDGDGVACAKAIRQILWRHQWNA